MIQALHLFGELPHCLEISMNPCVQGCEYCYAKTWKKCDVPIDKVVNDILRKREQKEGLIPFLLRKKMPIALSNRTDLMCAPDWRERLSAIKKLGNPIYLETKMNKDYKDLAEILDPETDEIYQTITGLNNKHEEHNLLSAEEKLEAGKFFMEKGFKYTLAVNPFMPDKCTVADIKYMLDYVKPHGFVMYDYHTTSKSIDKHLFMKEFPKDVCDNARAEIRKYCREKNILHDIFGWENNPYPELNLRIDENKNLCKGMGFVWQDFLIDIYRVFALDEFKNVDILEVTFDSMLDFYADQIDFWKDCIFKRYDYSPSAGKSNFRWEKDRFGIVDFLKGLWNQRKLRSIFDFYTDKTDKDGNVVYFRNRNGFRKFLGE